MEWKNLNGWLEFESIEKPLYKHYDIREVFNTEGNWLTSATDGYDFKMTFDFGYIRHWSNIEGSEEYILKVPRTRFEDLVQEYLFGEGRKAMEDYEEWEYKDGVYLATRIV